MPRQQSEGPFTSYFTDDGFADNTDGVMGVNNSSLKMEKTGKFTDRKALGTKDFTENVDVTTGQFKGGNDTFLNPPAISLLDTTGEV